MRLIRRQAAGDRRPRTRCIGGVDAVDVEGEVGPGVADDAPGLLRRRVRPVLMHPGGVEPGEAEAVFVVGADADLHRAGDVDDAFPGRVAEHRAVVDAPLLVAPGVAVGVEVHQGERTVAGRVGSEQGQGDEVIAADGEHRRSGVEDVRGVALDAGRDLGGPAVVEGAVAGVDDGEPLRRIEAHGHGGPHESCADAARTARGPRRAPGRLVVARSKGMPATATSTPSRSRVYGLRRKLSAPAYVASSHRPYGVRAVNALSPSSFSVMSIRLGPRRLVGVRPRDGR